MGHEGSAAAARACRAAAAIARDHGLRFAEPRVLSLLSTAIVHLPPLPLVARVPLLAQDVRPGSDWLRREVELCAWLASRRLPVAEPADVLPPGPHVHDGMRATFWRLVEPDGSPLDAEAAGVALRHVHEVLTEYPRPLPHLEPGAEVRRILPQLASLPAADVALLEQHLERLEADVADLGRPRQALHGDVHLFNVIQTAAGPVWVDFEDAAQGPREWDLASVVAHAKLEPERPEARRLLDAYGDVDREALEPFVLLRLLYVTAWSLLGAERAPARRPRAEARLAFWRARAA